MRRERSRAASQYGSSLRIISGGGLLHVVAAEEGRHLRRPKFRELPYATAIITYGDSLAWRCVAIHTMAG
jgi:hypothetical protein